MTPRARLHGESNVTAEPESAAPAGRSAEARSTAGRQPAEARPAESAARPGRPASGRPRWPAWWPALTLIAWSTAKPRRTAGFSFSGVGNRGVEWQFTPPLLVAPCERVNLIAV